MDMEKIVATSAAPYLGGSTTGEHTDLNTGKWKGSVSWSKTCEDAFTGAETNGG